MAKDEKKSAKTAAAPSLLSKLGMIGKAWRKENTAPAQEIDQSDTVMFGAGMSTAAALLGQDKRRARARQIIYYKWMRMEADPIVSTAIMLLVTAALGGHETSGDLVFIEDSPIVGEKDTKLKKIMDEIRGDLTPLFNRVAYQMAFTGAIYGDAYARIYSEPGKGVIDLSCDEMLRPILVQPFERAGRTVGYAIFVGERVFERLDVTQMARLKMPRTQWIPQFGVFEKSMKTVLQEDDINKVPIMPSLVGGSLLYNAEEAYDNLIASLLGLVGQRWIDSIDEQIFTVNMAGMNQEQQTLFMESMKRILRTSRALAEKAIKEGSPNLERVRYILPVANEKQLMQVQPPSGTGRNATINIEDVMLHARLLAGALGVDLSMIGFADQLSGGLGEGGFFRTSAQAAERARIIRVALTDFFNQIIDIHTLNKYNIVFDPKNRPWQINYYGSISALEAEKQRTKSDAMNAGGMLAQTIQLIKDSGFDEEMMREYLAKVMLLDDDQAAMFAKLANKKEEENPEGGNNGFGG